MLNSGDGRAEFHQRTGHWGREESMLYPLLQSLFLFKEHTTSVDLASRHFVR